MSTQPTREVLTEEQINKFHREGYLLIKGLWNLDEVEEAKQHFQELNAQGPIPGCFDIPKRGNMDNDPLQQYPRMLAPERISETVKKMMIHPTGMAMLADLFNEEPLAAGSMYYFKPPGARGQALHQDNYYLRIEPGTCIGCWIAIDPADEENGGLVVVPNTGNLEIQCPHEADRQIYVYADEVDIPEGTAPVPVNMDPGDALLFNGNIIHGSYPNKSKDRFRRSYIVHYIGMSSEKAGHHISFALTDRHGNVHTRESNQDAGPCGTILPNTVVMP